ncbi:hypothetical protein [Enterovibrio coralii]|uniref:hypothetical protein n=1 Tax=Enterovibrio coralii TaxID=294935 RepID=UPI0012FCD818|nr:hypothetical protein [Enterovibrio coralii]
MRQYLIPIIIPTFLFSSKGFIYRVVNVCAHLFGGMVEVRFIFGVMLVQILPQKAAMHPYEFVQNNGFNAFLWPGRNWYGVC